MLDVSDESDFDLTATRSKNRAAASGSVANNKLADLFSENGMSATPAAGNTAHVNSAVSFKYKNSQNKVSRNASTKQQTKTESGEATKSVLYQETVQLFQYQDQKHNPVGNVGIAMLGDVNAKSGFSLIVYASKQKPLVNVMVDSTFVITPQSEKYVCFYDQKRQLWYLLFSDHQKLTSFCMHVLICKSLTDSVESKIEAMDVIDSSSDEVVQKNSKAQIKYSAYLAEGPKVGKLIDGNNKDSSKTLSVDLSAKTASIIKGVKEGLVGMKKDATRIVFIPPKLGYGKTGVKNRVPPNAFLIYELKVVKISQESSRSSDSKGVPLPKLPSSKKKQASEDEEEEEDQEESEEEEEASQDEDESGGDSSTTTTNEDQSSSSKSLTRAKLLQKTARLGQAVLPNTNNGASKLHSKPSQRALMAENTYQEPRQSDMTMLATTMNPNPSNQLALFNSNTSHHQPQLPTSSMYQPYNGNPNPYHAPQPSTIVHHQMYPQQPMMQQHTPFAPSIPLASTTASFDQSTAGNLQLTLLESKQVQNDLRSHVMQVSSKLDQVQQKVEVLAARDTPFGTGNNQVTMEAAVLMQNINRIVQENERLRKEADEAKATVEGQTQKIASLLAQNQKYLEQSNIMLEQRNESFQSVSSASQIKITQLEQEKTQMLNELNSLNNKIAELQFDLSTQKQRQVDFKAQINEEALGKNQMREDLAASKNKITELEEDVSKLKQAYREQRAGRKVAEGRIGELEEQLTDSRAEVDSLSRQMAERKRRAEGEREVQQKEMEDLKSLHQSEIESWKLRLEQQRKVGSEASVALNRLESELETQWRLKCDKLVEQAREQLELQLKQANDRADTLQMEISKAKSTTNDVQVVLSAVTRELEESKWSQEQRIAQLQKDLSKAEEQLKESTKSDSPEVLLPEVKKIMNMIFQVLVKHITRESNYTGTSLLNFMKLVIKDVTLSVSSGQQPKALLDDEVLIEPVPEPEEDENDESVDESSNDEPEAELNTKSPVSNEPEPMAPVEQKLGNSTESEEIVAQEALGLESTQQMKDPLNQVTDTLHQDSPVSSAFREVTSENSDSHRRELGAESQLQEIPETNEVAFASGSPQDDEDVDTEELQTENSEPEDAIVLDPRNIPSESSDVESQRGDEPEVEDVGHPESTNQTDAVNMNGQMEEEAQPESDSVIGADSKEMLQVEVSSTEGESVLNSAAVEAVVEEEVNNVAEIEQGEQQREGEETSSTFAPIETPPREEEPTRDPTAIPRPLVETGPVSSGEVAFGSTPPSLPASPREDNLVDDDPLGTSNVFENDRIVGGSSLPALRTSPSPSSDGSEEPVGVPQGSKPDVNDDVEAELKEVLKKDAPPKAVPANAKSSKIFEDSDSDDSLFGNSLPKAKPPSLDSKKSSNDSSSAVKVSVDKNVESSAGDVAGKKPVSKNLAPLFPSDDEDEDLDWLK